MSPAEQVATIALVVIVVLSACLCADDLTDRMAARRARKEQADDERDTGALP